MKGLPVGFVLLALSGALPVAAAAPSAKPALTATEREATTLYQAGEYHRAIELLQKLPAGQEPGREVIRYGLLSQLKLGKPEEAWKLYPKLVATNQPDETAVLREIARGFILSRVRDSQEHIRIAAYTALAEMGEGETLPLLEDGLLDSSALVRARAAEAIGRLPPAEREARLRELSKSDKLSMLISDLSPGAEYP